MHQADCSILHLLKRKLCKNLFWVMRPHILKLAHLQDYVSPKKIIINIYLLLSRIWKSYLTDSYIVFTLKMESVPKIKIFGLKMMVKSCLEKIFLKFLHAEDYFTLLQKSAQNQKFSKKNNYHLNRPLFTSIFRPKMVFLDTDSILRVKTMYESVK